MSVGARLADAVRASGESLRAFAARAGVPYRTLQNYVGGVRAPQSDVLAQICTHTGVSGHWLLTGEGEMFVSGAALRGALREGWSDAAGTADDDAPVGVGTAAPAEHQVRDGPAPDAGLPPRLAALAALLEQIPSDAREAILSEAFARAATAQQLADLRQQLGRMQRTRGRTS